MERERFSSESVSARTVVPDTIPDELILAHQADARATVAATVTPELALRLWDEHGSWRSRFVAKVESRSVATRRASRPRTRGQWVQAVLAIVVGYAGLASLTTWWWSLAQAQGDSLWWTVTILGAGGLAVAALALLARAVMGVVGRRRRRLTADTGR